MCHHFLQSSDICIFILHYDQEAGLSHVRGGHDSVRGPPASSSPTPRLKSIYIYIHTHTHIYIYIYIHATTEGIFSTILCLYQFSAQNPWVRDLPGGPVVRTSPSNAEGAGVNPGQGAKILHVSRPKDQNIKQKLCCGKLCRWSTLEKNL